MRINTDIKIFSIQEPEYITVASINPKTNEYELAEQKNPKYCTESQKDFLMQLVKTIPGGQCLLIAGIGNRHRNKGKNRSIGKYDCCNTD